MTATQAAPSSRAVLRAAVATLLLLVQAAGLAHVVFAAHADGGDVVLDVRTEDAHRGDHVCATGAERQTEACGIFSQWRQVVAGEATQVWLVRAVVFAQVEEDERRSSGPLSALTLAPKASPPARG